MGFKKNEKFAQKDDIYKAYFGHPEFDAIFYN